MARDLASVEADPAAWEGRFHAALEDFRFLPAGRIMAGAGTGQSVTLFNCFVMGDIPDDLGGIFAHLREAALTMLRERGSEIDWLFTDITLPGLIDGWEVAAAYRGFHPRRPVIYASTAARSLSAASP